ncbi:MULTISPECIES: tetratricopeptide repeat protein [Vibrio]|uniref:tetratricopeptide repeat protein n=1 Tax=Vibrio TaxID=662 RepID=UPI00209BE941|nr:tetratricopeptide repeat protein [Vibrio parahaemolyticus]MCZ5860330.1 tetratricopeptide repeat protein [Vibrio parahaemolyticus]MCZ6279042.1 tetratricopeptide repeat protein [Vibrio parahaemolyticus]MDG3395385.1 tetratricopeptide repeat protein [Vibrio parahaemolyticus]MEA5303846.1 tetratricopeptide repeat protein [Vibrio parahaemolyticus]
MLNELRLKTAMVLHQLEESLGSFVLNEGNLDNLSVESLENIHKREAAKGRKFNKDSIKDIVEATYLDELFGFALDITEDSSTLDSINYLYSLFHHLDIYEIRNAVSHPNRPFWDCYWYRVASIASDPVNEMLGFTEVKKALISAEEGVISEPPEEWLNKVIWEIPNNLPDTFEHELTGLIGRAKELQELKKHISNPRVNTVALVAPGGAGKTALALDLLNTIISTPSYTKSVNSVIYVSMKAEKLTSNGVIPLSAIETIQELKQAILEAVNDVYDEDYSSFEQALKDKSEERILLCVDNLETLLRESPSSFDELNYTLPGNWQVLVTSRVTISNATIISLENLQKKSAVHLARTYHNKRGGRFERLSDYEKLTEKCFHNPLAIRLSIDLVLKGKDIPESLTVANKEIAEFSYNNLIDVLTTTGVEILECIFVEGSSSRLSLCELLGKSLDEVSEGVSELSRTSLITRSSHDEGESYALNDSVRELLLLSPRNLTIRTKVQASVEKRRVLSKEIDNRQTAEDFPVWHTDHIDKATNENLKILVTSFNREYRKARKNNELAISIYRRLKDAQFMHDDSALYHRTLARSLELLKDVHSAEKHYKKAQHIEPENPTSTYLLGRLYHATKRYDIACVQMSSLLKTEWMEPSSDNLQFGKSVYQTYFLSLLYDGKWQQVLDETKDWKNSDGFRSTLGTYRAAAWKRKMEHTVDSDRKATMDSLISAIRILGDVFRTNGYSMQATVQAAKIFEEIEFCCSRTKYQSEFREQTIELLKFVFTHISGVNETLTRKDMSLLIKKLMKINILGNPFSGRSFESYVDSVEAVLDDEVLSGGLVEVVIKRRPKSPSFLFAHDSKNQEYFLHYDNFKDGGWRRWIHLSLGERLHVVPELENVKRDKAIDTKEIYLVD